MRSIEKSGRTVEEALERALIELNLKEEEVDVEVLERESRGLLGLFGNRDAKVRVTEKKQIAEEILPVKLPQEVKTEETDVATETVQNYLENILKAMKIDACIDVETDDHLVSVTLHGEHMALLIGKRGQTLDSLQYLTSLALNRSREDYIHVAIDTENYREKRKEALEQLALRMAEKAKRQRKDILLNPMNSYERRIVHAALQKDPSVSTRSEGKDPYRRVIIFRNR